MTTRGIDSTTLARALGGHDDVLPSDAAHLRKLADETEEALVAHEVQFADDGWRDVLRLRALAAAMQDYVCARHRCFAPVDGGCPACRAERDRDEACRTRDELAQCLLDTDVISHRARGAGMIAVDIARWEAMVEYARVIRVRDAKKNRNVQPNRNASDSGEGPS